MNEVLEPLGTCEDPDLCRDDAEQERPCGPGDAGTQRERCAAGRWELEGSCEPHFVALGTGQAHTCGLHASGLVSCWGRGSRGELGDGNTKRISRPVLVQGLTDATAIALGSSHSCALRRSGEVVCWGFGETGALGQGRFENASSPVGVMGLTDAVALAAGSGHTCALRADGRVWCWGAAGGGQASSGALPDVAEPVAVAGVENAPLRSSQGSTTVARC